MRFSAPKCVCVSLLVLSGLVASAASAQESPEQRPGAVEPDQPASVPLGVGGEVSLRSRYVWRGLPFSQGPVVQPSAWASIAQCGASAWGNIALPESQQKFELDEVDLGAQCGLELGRWSAEFGAVAYLFPGEEALPTGEALGLVEVELGWLTVFTGHAVDFAATPGAYAGQLGLAGVWERQGHAIEASVRAGWASASFNEVNAGVERAALDFVEPEIAVLVQLGAGLTVRAHAGASLLVYDRIREVLGESTVLDFGVTVVGDWAL